MTIQLSNVGAQEIKQALAKVRSPYQTLAKKRAGSILYRVPGGDGPEGSQHVYLFASQGKLGFMLFNDNATAIWHPEMDAMKSSEDRDVDAGVVVSLDDFYKVVKRVKTKDTFDIRLDDGEVTFDRGNRSYTVTGYPEYADRLSRHLDNILLSSYEECGSHDRISNASVGVTKGLRSAHNFVSSDTARPNLTYVNYKSFGDRVAVTSTDGHRLYNCTVVTGAPERDEALEIGVEPVVLRCFDSLFNEDSAVSLDVASNFRPTSSLTDQDVVTNECDLFKITCENFVLASHCDMQGVSRFPDYLQILPPYTSQECETQDYQSAILGRKELISALKECAEFTGVENAIKVEKDFSEETFIISNVSEGREVEFSVGIPMRDDHHKYDKNHLRMNVKYMIEAAQNFDDYEYVLFRSQDPLHPTVMRGFEDSRPDEGLIVTPGSSLEYDEFILVMPRTK